ncbi:MAG: hypothetical protein ACYDGL_06150 [Bellilinea sp.]
MENFTGFFCKNLINKPYEQAVRYFKRLAAAIRLDAPHRSCAAEPHGGTVQQGVFIDPISLMKKNDEERMVLVPHMPVSLALRCYLWYIQGHNGGSNAKRESLQLEWFSFV